MIYQFNNFDDFVKQARDMGITSDLKALLTLDIIFHEEYEDYLIISLPDFDSQPNKVLILSEQKNLIYPEVLNVKHPLYSKKVKKKRLLEPSVTAFLILRRVLSNYTAHYEKLKRQIDHASDCLDIEEIEGVYKRVKKFWDVIHDFERLMMELEEHAESKLVDTEIVGYDYDVLLARATHLSDRVRGAKKEINVARGKCEVNYSKQLNKNIERLTYIMAYLTIITVIISIPNTVATIYGVPTLAQTADVLTIVLLLVATTIITVILSWLFIKKWKI